VQNGSGSGLLNCLKYSMTDAGVSGEGTQSAKASLPNNTAVNNNAIGQRLSCRVEVPHIRRLCTQGKFAANNLCASSPTASAFGFWLGWFGLKPAEGSVWCGLISKPSPTGEKSQRYFKHLRQTET
jgi:hypothetical protein